jgi:hypothetical protein
LILKEGPRVTVRSAATGDIQGQASYSRTPVVACIGQDRGFVGEARLVLADLPSLRVIWKKDFGAPITDVRAMKNFVAFRLANSAAVFLLPLR